MDFTLQQLRMLREVATRNTIAAAAESLGYTASAVSQQLAGLERSTGVAVLERIGRNVRLTDAGRELVRHANELLAGVEAAQVALERVQNEVRGDLEITVYESVAATLLPTLLGQLAERYPELRVRTRQCDPDLAIEALALGDVDLALTIGLPHKPSSRGGRPGCSTDSRPRPHSTSAPGRQRRSACDRRRARDASRCGQPDARRSGMIARPTSAQ
jgi:DNA-binding transcriptional LysR family regulator